MSSTYQIKIKTLHKTKETSPRVFEFSKKATAIAIYSNLVAEALNAPANPDRTKYILSKKTTTLTKTNQTEYKFKELESITL